jgi:hypothetical protein
MSNPSRTLSLLQSVSCNLTLPNDLLPSVTVTNGEKFTYYICKDLNTVNTLETFLNSKNLRFNRSSYSLFVRFNNQSNRSNEDIHKDLVTFVNNLLSNVNITYSRIDESLSTGKLCVDLYDNYLKLKSLNDSGDFRFFAFNSKRVFNNNQENSFRNNRSTNQRSTNQRSTNQRSTNQRFNNTQKSNNQ